MKDCRVCLGPCQRDIHQATENVHRRWRKRLEEVMNPKPIEMPIPKSKRVKPQDPPFVEPKAVNR